MKFLNCLVALLIVLLSGPFSHHAMAGSTPDFCSRIASQLSRQTAVLAGIASEMGNRTGALAEGSEERTLAVLASDELNDVGFVLMLGGALLGGCHMIEAEHKSEYYLQLAKVLDRTVLKLSNKLVFFNRLKEKTGEPRTIEDLSRAITAIEKCRQLLDQSAKSLIAGI